MYNNSIVLLLFDVHQCDNVVIIHNITLGLVLSQLIMEKVEKMADTIEMPEEMWVIGRMKVFIK